MVHNTVMGDDADGIKTEIDRDINTKIDLDAGSALTTSILM